MVDAQRRKRRSGPSQAGRMSSHLGPYPCIAPAPTSISPWQSFTGVLSGMECSSSNLQSSVTSDSSSSTYSERSTTSHCDTCTTRVSSYGAPDVATDASFSTRFFSYFPGQFGQDEPSELECQHYTTLQEWPRSLQIPPSQSYDPPPPRAFQSYSTQLYPFAGIPARPAQLYGTTANGLPPNGQLLSPQWPTASAHNQEKKQLRCNYPSCEYKTPNSRHGELRLKTHTNRQHKSNSIPCPEEGCIQLIAHGRIDNLTSHRDSRKCAAWARKKAQGIVGPPETIPDDFMSPESASGRSDADTRHTSGPLSPIDPLPLMDDAERNWEVYLALDPEGCNCGEEPASGQVPVTGGGFFALDQFIGPLLQDEGLFRQYLDGAD